MAVNALALNDATTALEMPAEYCGAATVRFRYRNRVTLDRSMFYPNLSGQPCDRGELIRQSDGRAFRVLNVEFDGDLVWHELEANSDCEVGDRVVCRVDPSWRYFFSRSHSAAVLVSGIAHNRWSDCFVTSCGLFDTHVRLDFSGGPSHRDEATMLLAEANSIIAQGGEITARLVEMEEALAHRSYLRSRALQDDFDSETIGDKVRVVRITSHGETVEEQLDLGTHVENLHEIGVLFPGTKDQRSLSDNKGQEHFRMRFFLK